MTATSIANMISAAALGLAILSFSYAAVLRQWRDRARLRFEVTKAKIHVNGNGTDSIWMRLTVINIGFRPIIITGCSLIADRRRFRMGVDDEPAAAYGIEARRFPRRLEPAELMTIHLIRMDLLEEDFAKTKNPNLQHDPFRYIVLVDSFNRLHTIDMKEIRNKLRIQNMAKRKKGLRRIQNIYAARRYCRSRKHLIF